MPESSPPPASRIVWVITDGKPGHENQSLGLAEALARATPVEIHLIPALPTWRGMLAWLTKRMPGKAFPAPDLILGAGHATHLTLLAARRARGGKSLVLMNPSLPRRCFDLCIVPRHDGVAAGPHTFISDGAFNRIRAANRDTSSSGLILIGGPSPHFDWDNDAVRLQIKSLLARLPETRWTLTTSRRTPPDFLTALSSHANLNVVPHTATPSGWLPTQLAQSNPVWVSPDSVSMVYEALTSGADVGVFDLPVNPRSRVGWAIAQLAESRRITRFVNWCAHDTLHHNTQPLAEADRCANWIIEWLKPTN